jgi:hypothetical protein
VVRRKVILQKDQQMTNQQMTNQQKETNQQMTNQQKTNQQETNQQVTNQQNHHAVPKLQDVLQEFSVVVTVVEVKKARVKIKAMVTNQIVRNHKKNKNQAIYKEEIGKCHMLSHMTLYCY